MEEQTAVVDLVAGVDVVGRQSDAEVLVVEEEHICFEWRME